MTGCCFLLRQVLGCDSFFLPVTIGLAILPLASAVHAHLMRKQPLLISELVILLPFAIPVILLIWGTIMAHQDNQTLAPSWPAWVAVTLLASYVPLTGIAIWKAKGFRLLASATGLLAGWFSVLVYLPTVMAITGNWI